MPTFKGKNTIFSAAQIAFDRVQYNTLAFPENGGLGPQQVVNFNFAERILYGRIDRLHNPVIADPQFIHPVYSTNTANTLVQAMNFVVAQFNDFQDHYRRACRMRLIAPDDPILSVIEATQGYEDPLNAYRNYMKTLMNSYIVDFLVPIREKIRTIDDFLKYFLEFLSALQSTFPATLSGYQRSNQSSIFSSGLVINLGAIDWGDDEEKQDLILDNPAFEYYIGVAKQYGFSINKINPSVLISDLASPATIGYRGNYNLPTVDSVFSKQYKKTLYSDLEELKYMLTEYYNIFVDKFPEYTNLTTCLKATHIQKFRRDYINNLDNMYNVILKLYINIRNMEEIYPYNDIESQDLFKTALRLKNQSEVYMLDYIDEQFRKKYTYKNGSLTYHRKKIRKKLDK